MALLPLLLLVPGAPAAGKVAPAVVTDVGEGTARFARAIIARDLGTLVALSPAPFSFDGATAQTAAEVRNRWAEILDRHPVERLKLLGVEVVGAAEMVKKNGPPPARLAHLPLQGSTIGIANLNGRATLVLWHKDRHGWRAFAVSD